VILKKEMIKSLFYNQDYHKLGDYHLKLIKKNKSKYNVLLSHSQGNLVRNQFCRYVKGQDPELYKTLYQYSIATPASTVECAESLNDSSNSYITHNEDLVINGLRLRNKEVLEYVYNTVGENLNYDIKDRISSHNFRQPLKGNISSHSQDTIENKVYSSILPITPKTAALKAIFSIGLGLNSHFLGTYLEYPKSIEKMRYDIFRNIPKQFEMEKNVIFKLDTYVDLKDKDINLYNKQSPELKEKVKKALSVYHQCNTLKERMTDIGCKFKALEKLKRDLKNAQNDIFYANLVMLTSMSASSVGYKKIVTTLYDKTKSLNVNPVTKFSTIESDKLIDEIIKDIVIHLNQDEFFTLVNKWYYDRNYFEEITTEERFFNLLILNEFEKIDKAPLRDILLTDKDIYDHDYTMFSLDREYMKICNDKSTEDCLSKLSKYQGRNVASIANTKPLSYFLDLLR